MATVKAAALVVAAVAAVLAQLATAAVVHKVGGDGKWDTSGSYDAWSAAQKFAPGDSIAFTYPPSHDVVEVSEAGYKACSPAGAVASYTGGSTTVKLTAPGKRYFICGIPGHCASGMKLAVNVAAAAATAPGAKPSRKRSVAPTTSPAPAPAPAPETSGSTDELPTVSSPTDAPAPKASGAANTGANDVVALLAMGMAVALAM